MSVSIHPLRLGVDHCYIVRGERAIMIDGGVSQQGKSFMRGIERLSMKPED